MNYKSFLRGLVSLSSVPSTPVTAVTLAVGYASVTRQVITPDIISLVVAGALAHWGFFSMNDVLDHEVDKKQERTEKPLVSGSLSIKTATVFSIMLILVSTTVAVTRFRALAFYTFTICYALGALYNSKSKDFFLSPLILGIWGGLIVMTGALYAGDVSYPSYIMALVVGVHMFIMAVIGDHKDINGEEESISKMWGSKVVDKNGYKIRWVSRRFGAFLEVLKLLQILLIIIIPISDGLSVLDAIALYLAFMGTIVWTIFYHNSVKQRPYRPEKISKSIAAYEATSVATILVASWTILGAIPIAAMVLSTVIWGLGWQTVLYGHPLRFP